jgi:3-deoxy-7-phosphoheptulonate synthase
MIIEVDKDADAGAVAALCDSLATGDDVTTWPVSIGGRCFVAVSGDEARVPDIDAPIVVGRHSTNARGYWLVDRANGVAPSTVNVGDAPVGRGPLWCAAGPCALESFGDAVATGLAVRQQGAHALRIGIFKPRTSPYNFRGKQGPGIKLLPELKAAVGLPVVTEVLDPRDVGLMAEAADCLQVGTRNMTNQALLKELGTAGRPVLLKRGYRTPVEEWLRAAEFIVAHGNPAVILCARGISSFDTSLRFMPDLGAVLAARERTDLPVVFDPSHSAGRADAVAQVALAAAAFGVDGLLIEAHIAPERMYRPGDGGQAYEPAKISSLLAACTAVRDITAGL